MLEYVAVEPFKYGIPMTGAHHNSPIHSSPMRDRPAEAPLPGRTLHITHPLEGDSKGASVRQFLRPENVVWRVPWTIGIN
jgi:hypothetical protein